MTVRKLLFLAAAFGLVFASAPVFAESKPTTMSAKENQALADSVASKLRSSGVMKGAKVNIETNNGTVLLSGTAADAKQHEAILRAITSVPGIKRIESEIQVPDAAPSPIRRTANQELSPLAVPGGADPVPPPKTAPAAPPVVPPATLPSTTGLPPVGTPPAGFGGLSPQDPVPLNGGGMMAPLDPAGPKMPPYAWPTYAPYNNYSRVAYPGAYPYNAFPYIGPFYPFPKVPLGWRKVVLEWDDGHWYIGRLSTPKDYWRVRFH